MNWIYVLKKIYFTDEIIILHQITIIIEKICAGEKYFLSLTTAKKFYDTE